MYRVRMSLRLFYLVCISSSLFLAWLGLTYEYRDLESQTARTNYRWKFISNSSQLYLNDNGDIYGAEIRDAADMELLLRNYQVACSRMKYLCVCSPEAYTAFQAHTFPSVKKLHLANVKLTPERLAKTGVLADLEMLILSEREGDLSLTWSELDRIPNLKHLVLDVSPEVSFTEFPEFKELRTIRFSSPNATSEQIIGLQRRMPNCIVIGPE